MSAAQQKLYRAALTIGRNFGTGGRAWTYLEPSGNGISADVTLSNQGLVTLYVLRNFLDRERRGAPNTPIFAADWLAVGAADLGILTGGILISANDGQVFACIGQAETDQGFTLLPLAPAQNPIITSAATHGAGYRAGLRLGLRLGM